MELHIAEAAIRPEDGLIRCLPFIAWYEDLNSSTHKVHAIPSISQLDKGKTGQFC